MLEKTLSFLEERLSFAESILGTIPSQIEKFKGYDRVEIDEKGMEHIYTGGQSSIDMLNEQKKEYTLFVEDAKKGIEIINSLNKTGEGDIQFLESKINSILNEAIQKTRECLYEFEKLNFPEEEILEIKKILDEWNDAGIELLFFTKSEKV